MEKLCQICGQPHTTGACVEQAGVETEVGVEALQREWKKRVVFMLEDSDMVLKVMAAALKNEQGSPPDDGQLLQAFSYNEMQERIAELQEVLRAGVTVLMISDIQVPRNRGEVANEDFGFACIEDLATAIDNWNTTHPDDEPVNLEVYINSTVAELPGMLVRAGKATRGHSIIGAMNSAGGYSKTRAFAEITEVFRERLINQQE